MPESGMGGGGGEGLSLSVSISVCRRSLRGRCLLLSMICRKLLLSICRKALVYKILPQSEVGCRKARLWERGGDGVS